MFIDDCIIFIWNRRLQVYDASELKNGQKQNQDAQFPPMSPQNWSISQGGDGLFQQSLCPAQLKSLSSSSLLDSGC